jgi:hypothetical protein
MIVGNGIVAFLFDRLGLVYLTCLGIVGWVGAALFDLLAGGCYFGKPAPTVSFFYIVFLGV